MIEIDGQQKVVADVASGQDAIKQCNKLRPEICLLDMRMPGLVGIETAQHFFDAGRTAGNHFLLPMKFMQFRPLSCRLLGTC